MILKSINVLVAYLVTVLFTAICVALTYYWPQISTGADLNFKDISDMVAVVVVSLVVFASPVTLIMGLLAYFKKINSPSFYVIAGVFSVMAMLMFVPGLQGVEGDENSLWVPFMGVLGAGLAGYMFWAWAIQKSISKTVQS